MSHESIVIKGARQNNLKNLDLELPTNEMIVVTGVSGSGKSTLAFDTIYAEGQRRYVETFSAYARQFLDRMDKPSVDSIEGIPPAIAIDQSNPVRTSRSTVGTMTELNDYLKLLFARMATLYCHSCHREVTSDSAQSIVESLFEKARANPSPRIMVCLPISVPDNFTDDEVVALLNQQGYTRLHKRSKKRVEVVQDRLLLKPSNRERLNESIEMALHHGNGHVLVYPLDENKNAGDPWRFSNHNHCPDCDISYSESSPSLFSFNSPIGACDSCRGFGRIIGVDYGLVIPNETLTLAGGAVKPFQTPSNEEIQHVMIKYAKKQGIPIDKPWKKLTKKQQRWVIEGQGEWEEGVWFGVARFFQWLERKAYKMHIRVLLSKYRSYTRCTSCDGARLKPEALWWRLGVNHLINSENTQAAPNQEVREVSPQYLADIQASVVVDTIVDTIVDTVVDTPPGMNVHQVMQLPLEQCAVFFNTLTLPAPFDEAAELLLGEIRSRLNYLLEVGLGYLTLDRQSRTLSGGEVQRINLTTALGTSLVNTLFVLDEPSIGLHPRDINRLVSVLHRLRDAGNTLLVVEHDPQVILAADRVLDIGPGPGEQGGEICFLGTPKALLKDKKALTAQYLTGKKSVFSPPTDLAEADNISAQCIQVIGASEHNLKNIDVSIPLNKLVCITGVSGSGKSTLMRDVLYPGLCKLKGQSADYVGAHKAIKGQQFIQNMVLVDQSPIGKTTRSIPATYVGAFDAIRKIFLEQPLAVERKYTPGTFSFNSGNGRCPTCSGNGFEHVEMQFLSDVYLRCSDCDGKRYRDAILEVKIMGSLTHSEDDKQSQSIADVLDMTVAQALYFFSDSTAVVNSLQPLSDVGLHYIKLGQAVPTLSGGEAQRLKLAGHLAKNKTFNNKKSSNKKRTESTEKEQGTLLLFDEPTTGLHFDDIAKLMTAFKQLIDAGHSLLVIEHNLDVIRSADWIIDIGPEGGSAGGQLIAEGRPEQITKDFNTHTAIALRDYNASIGKPFKLAASKGVAAGSTSKATQAKKTTQAKKANRAIEIHNAREHNLKNIDITIPRDKFTVISGVSGSGKSTVAFDIVFGEGQRRYLESLNAYARQFVQPASRPDVDAVHGIPPTVAIEQRTSRGGRKSTVATLTEIYHFMRLLYVKLGVQYCPDCDEAIEPQTVHAIVARIQKDYRGRGITLLAPMVVARKGIYKELAKWAAEKGFEQLRVDKKYLPTDPWPVLDRYKEHSIELPVGDVTVKPQNESVLLALLNKALDLGNGIVIVTPSKQAASKKDRLADVLFSTERSCPCCGQGFDELDPRLFSYNSKHGWCEKCYGTGVTLKGFDQEQTGEEQEWLHEEDDVAQERECRHCEGSRLNNIALSVRFRDQSIAQLASCSVEKAQAWFNKLKLRNQEQAIAKDLLAELNSRLSFLSKVGLNYLTLDRAAPTLSGGEAQRIRLASQLGSNLQGVCYILDEPTIGLHTRDNRRLITTLRELQQQGNTVLVVEHDEDTIREADYLIDMGPRAGVEGGEVVAHGTLSKLVKQKKSLTGQFIASPLRHPMPDLRNLPLRDIWDEEALNIVGATQNNLANISQSIPLRKLVCVSGVSGSGKSTLVRAVLQNNLKPIINKPGARRKYKKTIKWRGCDDIQGWDSIARVLEVDQTPIGKTPRSCPATYIGIWDAIRKLFAGTVDARLRGYKPGRFSFNTGDGRCEACGGHGMRKIAMNFLPDVRVECEVCHGWRFNSETLTVRYKEKHIGEVLTMNIDAATTFFESVPSIHHALQLLQDVGLGYLTLGQQSPTLSGGEAQRIKLVAELSKARIYPHTLLIDQLQTVEGREQAKSLGQHNLYILDEPTVGLHMADVEKLLRVLHRLVDAGNSVIVIEHNLDVIAEADWVVDMGPEGGTGGGKVVAQGTPETLCKRKRSHTGRYLSELIARQR
jgi:excinuclease ABC subunit A